MRLTTIIDSNLARVALLTLAAGVTGCGNTAEGVKKDAKVLGQETKNVVQGVRFTAVVDASNDSFVAADSDSAPVGYQLQCSGAAAELTAPHRRHLDIGLQYTGGGTQIAEDNIDVRLQPIDGDTQITAVSDGHPAETLDGSWIVTLHRDRANGSTSFVGTADLEGKSLRERAREAGEQVKDKAQEKLDDAKAQAEAAQDAVTDHGKRTDAARAEAKGVGERLRDSVAQMMGWARHPFGGNKAQR